MNKAPKIGERIKLNEGHRYFPCVGTIEKIHPKKNCITEADDPRWDDQDFFGEYDGMLPESEWQVTMVVDVLPKDWAYGENCKKFCPDVSELEPAP